MYLCGKKVKTNYQLNLKNNQTLIKNLFRRPVVANTGFNKQIMKTDYSGIPVKLFLTAVDKKTKLLKFYLT